MTTEEYVKCIKRINPEAMVVVWDENGVLIPKYDEAHKGAKPTIAECEAVLPQIQMEIARPKAIEAIQSVLDAKAKEFGFDTIHTAAVWTISKNPARKARADALVAWGDQWWDYAEAEWAKQVTGESTFTTVDEFLAAGPKFNEGL
jgi:hypothetical protein